ncbi:NAD-dependent epimerase/dehydratase family protein [Streptomyces sp. NPDC020807]|uniref:NAD-dependent epimerase/dehydratase family protein n=1 Tax=Streptomyces sp. NPDC020807 TaxID=3155119 RepID=UPI0034044477
MGPRLLITGASGFVGGRAAAAATARAGIAHVRLLTRTEQPPRPRRSPESPHPSAPVVENVLGDLRDPASLRRACEGVDVLVHCAAAIGADEETARQVNDEGTRSLVDAAVRAGVTRIVALSTASVHGRGTFRAAAPGTLPIAPGSTTSRTRAAGERHVLDAGGTVLRPHLVYGTGDRQLVPGLVRLLTALPGPFANGGGAVGSVHSVIDVESLAGALLGAALSPRTEPGAYYVGHPEPVPAAALIAAAETLTVRPPEAPGTPVADVAAACNLLADLPFAQHHLAMLATDHWFADDRPWRELGCVPGPGFAEGFAAHAPWYRRLLLGAARSGPTPTS